MVENLTVKVKKLYKGYVSVRDYDFQTCLREHRNLVISYDGLQMTVSFDELEKSAKTLTTQVFKSKFDTKPYKLIDFHWKPDIDNRMTLERWK